MNILLLDSGNTYNYGSMMMAENFIYYSSDCGTAKNKYYVSTNNEVHIERLKDATGIEEIYSVKVNDLFKGNLAMAYAKKKIIRIDTRTDLCKSMDKIIFLGGDDFTEIYGGKQLMGCVYYVDALRYKDNYIALVGQSIGPFDKKREKFILSVLKKMDLISLRDPVSLNYLKNVNKFSNSKSVTDLALLPLAKEVKPLKNTKDYVVLCPSEIMYRHAKISDRDSFIEINSRICEYVLDKLPNIKLVLLPHVWNDGTHGDAHIMREIFTKIEDKYKERIQMNDFSMQPYEVRNLIYQSKFLIAERMHPAISGLECEVPSVVFSYGRKYEGIFEKLYNLEDIIVDVRNFDDYNVMLTDIKNKVDFVIQHDDELRKKIATINIKTRPVALNHIKEIMK